MNSLPCIDVPNAKRQIVCHARIRFLQRDLESNHEREIHVVGESVHRRQLKLVAAIVFQHIPHLRETQIELRT